MKKYLIIFTFFILFIPVSVSAKKITVKLYSCVDGDTANFIMSSKKIKVRFLAIDTPEIKHGKKEAEPFGDEASNFTCNALKKANKVELEFDKNSSKYDKYKRYLAWIFVDDELLQEKLISKGYAEIKYVYGDYLYINKLTKVEKTAKKNHKGIWGNENSFEDMIKNLNIFYKFLLTILVIIIISVYLYFDKKARRRVLRKGKKDIKKLIKNSLK